MRFNLQFGKAGYLVESDIKGFFDHIDHEWLLRMLKERIDDAAFLNLIREWLKAGIFCTDGIIIHPETGTQRGGVVSPVLANVYLHYVITSTMKLADLPGNVALRKGEANMPRRCVINVTQIKSVDSQSLKEKIGSLSEKRIREVHEGLKLVMNLKE